MEKRGATQSLIRTVPSLLPLLFFLSLFFLLHSLLSLCVKDTKGETAAAARDISAATQRGIERKFLYSCAKTTTKKREKRASTQEKRKNGTATAAAVVSSITSLFSVYEENVRRSNDSRKTKQRERKRKEEREERNEMIRRLAVLFFSRSLFFLSSCR